MFVIVGSVIVRSYTVSRLFVAFQVTDVTGMCNCVMHQAMCSGVECEMLYTQPSVLLLKVQLVSTLA